MTSINKLITSLALIFLLSGCAALESLLNQEPSRPTKTSVTSTKDRPTDTTTRPPAGTNDGIEITWQVPSESVDGFIVRYGYEKGKLDQEVRIARTDLRDQKDPEYGPIYRYIIPNIKKNSTVFVSVAAFRGDRISEFSDVVQEAVAK